MRLNHIVSQGLVILALLSGISMLSVTPAQAGSSPVTLYTPPLISNTAGATPVFCSVVNVSDEPVDVIIEVIEGGTSQNKGLCTGLPAGQPCNNNRSIGSGVAVYCKFTLTGGRAGDVRAALVWLDAGGFPTGALQATAAQHATEK